MVEAYMNAEVRAAMLELALKQNPGYSEQEILDLPETYANRMFLDPDKLYQRFHDAFMLLLNHAMEEGTEPIAVNVEYNPRPNQLFLLALKGYLDPARPSGDWLTYDDHMEAAGAKSINLYASCPSAMWIDKGGTIIRNHPFMEYATSSTAEEIMRQYLAISYSIYEAAGVPGTVQQTEEWYRVFQHEGAPDPVFELRHDEIVDQWFQHFFKLKEILGRSTVEPQKDIIL